MRRTTRSTLFLFLFLALPGLLLAQSQSGTIRGTVVSAGDQAPLPGVTLTISGTGFRQTFVTDVDGEFRFLGLHPGTYTVEAQLAGFSTVRRNVDVSLGRNSDVTLSLTPALSEAITVVAATPVIDTRDTGT
ncbi:MAG TPA: carboxypeptidase regulatory-like domain-containing protein [Thermoanaerobaculia bacterium]|nr:carboxypeptidase regulatory-like domain-containing protein [Thermoanaerobaculia bacterium]